jgi:hypothetical protein
VPALDNNELVLRYQQAFVDKLLSYSLRYPHVLYCMNNETGEDVAWSDFWARYVRARKPPRPASGSKPPRCAAAATSQPRTIAI